MTKFSDPVTGRPVRSGRIYENGSSESSYFKNIAGLPSQSSYSFEWEFSKRAIVGSSAFRVQGEGGDYGEWGRLVFMGSFNTKKGLSGRLDAFAVGDKAIGRDEYGVNIVKLANPVAFSGIQQLGYIVQDNPPSEPTTYYSNDGTAASNGLMPVTSLSQLVPTGFFPFYGDIWWDNPFNGDLV